MTKRIIKVALCVVRDGKLLLARSRGDAHFQIPGGKIEPSESELDALTRETSEELDVALHQDTAVHLATFEAPAAGRTDVLVEVRLYRADFTGDPRPSSEIAQLHWQPLAGPVAECSEVVELHILPFLAKQDQLRGVEHE
ncbi:MAG: NUDIX domain-containing protein [Roseobacter sp.]